jgi:hypothetical protein
MFSNKVNVVVNMQRVFRIIKYFTRKGLWFRDLLHYSAAIIIGYVSSTVLYTAFLLKIYSWLSMWYIRVSNEVPGWYASITHVVILSFV